MRHPHVLAEPPAEAASAVPRASRRAALRALTGIRFLAAAQVVFLHYGLQNMAASPKWLQDLVGAGRVGVDLFFVLSGFILTYTYADAGGLRTGRRSFWIARFARVYPMYLLALLIMAPLQLRAGDSMGSGLDPEKLGGIPWAITLTQTWVPGLATFLNPPAWSLSVEAFLYAVFPFVAATIRQWSVKRCLRTGAALWLVAPVIPAIYLLAESVGLPAWSEAERAVWLITLDYAPILYLPVFVMGCLTGRLFLLHQPVASTQLRRSFGGLSVLALAGTIAALSFSSPVPELILHHGLVAPFFCALVYALAWDVGPLAWLLGRAVMVQLGDASYAMYLLQAPVWLWASVIAARAGQWSVTNTTSWSWFVVCGVALVLLSLALHHGFERPARRWITTMLGGAARPVAQRAERRPDLEGIVTVDAR